ncbi:c-type cytochrome [Desulfuromonas versatilis]|uniref:C-type cytochrome n=1 Tax=Desulfuromonas versatilis TaxID=2802975 RepID=A0ABN6DW43_9BACT|nr:hypothetical protein [Desulfuromonas versatilis]BCR03997.1 c-type cytochrome [Desulfuromonas versatilis]
MFRTSLFKKAAIACPLIGLLLLLAGAPAAQAWFVNAKTSSPAEPGSVTPAGNTYVAGATGTSAQVTVAPQSGFQVARVTLDGQNIAPAQAPQSPSTPSVYVVPYNGKAWRYLVAYFEVVAGNLEISVTLGSGGACSETGGRSLSGITPGSDRTLLFSPHNGYRVSTITAPNADLVDNGNSTWSATYTNLQASQGVSAAFEPIPRVTAHAGPDVYAQGNGAAFPAYLDARQSSSNQGPIVYAWSGPPELVFATPNAKITEVYSDTPGVYTATLSITSGGYTSTDSALVNIPARAAFLQGYCTPCHVTRDADVTAAYGLSKHKTTGPGSTMAVCQACHDPTSNGHYSIGRPTGVCQPCHANVPGSTHATAEMADLCLDCHNPHSTAVTAVNIANHFDGVFGTGAQYVSQNAACPDCHADGSFSANSQILDDFATSGHASTSSPAWIAGPVFDWPVRPVCRNCHSTPGFIEKVTGTPTPVTAGQPGQILACNACHLSVATGEVRVLDPVTVSFLNYNITLSPSNTFPNLGPSNVCVNCHSGRAGGSTIASSTADFSNSSVIDPHKLATAAVMWKAGYQYAGLSYQNPVLFAHPGIGVGNGGPCASCHMNLGNSSHTFRATEINPATGLITSVSPVCAFCHLQAMSPEGLRARKQGFSNALNALKAQLAARGIHYHDSFPYFFTAPYVEGAGNTPVTNWNQPYPGRGKDLMGAAFNFNLLANEPGAYTHNSVYTKRLIFDSIDFLDNGVLNGIIDITSLMLSAGYSASDAASAATYLDGSLSAPGIQRYPDPPF